MKTPTVIKDFIEEFCEKMVAPSDAYDLNRDWLTNIKYRNHRMLHSRILGLLVSTGHSLGYVVDVERGLKPIESRVFDPDLLFWKNGKAVLLCEYESTNSSDLRIITKDMRNYIHATENGLDEMSLPEYWIIITTLPNRPVESWSTWHIDKEKRARYQKLKQNPKAFYYTIYKNHKEGLRKLDQKHLNKSMLFLLNINEEGLTIEFPKSSKTTFPIDWR